MSYFSLKDVLDWSEMEVGTTFFKTLSRRLPWDALKTSLTCLKTSSRFFLVKAIDHLETINGLPIYVRFKLHTCYHSITRQTNCINLNKLKTLKHGNSTELMTIWCLMTFQTRRYFFQELRYFFSTRVSHTGALFKCFTPEVWKKFLERILI